MSIFTQFKTNKNCEENGILVRFKPNEDGSIPSFRIGRASRSNKRWLVAFEAKTRPYKTEIKDGIINDEDAQRINLEVFCSALLLGWSNIQDSDGQDIQFTYDNAIRLFTDLPELYEMLGSKSSDMSNFLESNLKADEKN